jgi:hypothetical protein
MHMRNLIVFAILAILAAVPASAQVSAIPNDPPGETNLQATMLNAGERNLHIFTVACYSTAIDVVEESPSVTNHAARLYLANLIIDGRSGVVATLWALSVGSNNNQIPDLSGVSFNIVKNRVSAVWNYVALVKYYGPGTPGE